MAYQCKNAAYADTVLVVSIYIVVGTNPKEQNVINIIQHFRSGELAACRRNDSSICSQLYATKLEQALVVTRKREKVNIGVTAIGHVHSDCSSAGARSFNHGVATVERQSDHRLAAE